jgi:hypothetical protein
MAYWRLKNKIKHKREISELLKIFLSNILPSLLTAIIGGVMVALLVPAIQYDYSIKQIVNAKKIDLLSSTAETWTAWMNHLGKAEVSLHQKKTKEAAKELEVVTEQFNKLKSILTLVEYIYQSKDIKKKITEFREWYNDVYTRGVNLEVKPGAPIVVKRDELLDLMGQELARTLK